MSEQDDAATKRQAVGKRVRMARHAAGLSQEDLATAAGVRGQTIHRYERGAVLPGLDALEGIAAATSVTMDWLATGEGAAPEAAA